MEECWMFPKKLRRGSILSGMDAYLSSTPLSVACILYALYLKWALLILIIEVNWEIGWHHWLEECLSGGHQSTQDPLRCYEWQRDRALPILLTRLFSTIQNIWQRCPFKPSLLHTMSPLDYAIKLKLLSLFWLRDP